MEQLSKAQSLTDIRVRIHSIKTDGTDNTGDVANMSTIIKDPAGTTLTPGIDYDEATFFEIGSTGDYNCLFSLTALNPAFTLIDQNNPYRVILTSSTAGTSSPKDVRIVSKLPGELSTFDSATDGVFMPGVKNVLDDLNDLALGDIQGEIQNGVLAKKIIITGDPFEIVEGNIKTLVITLGAEWNLTGKFVYFVMSKINSSDAPIVNRKATITDAINGIAEIDLLSTETTPEGCYEYQVELRNDPADDEPETAMEGTAEITENLRS
jgi:hypothetical protein